MNNRYYHALLLIGVILLLIVGVQHWQLAKQEIQPQFYSSYISDKPIDEVNAISLFFADNQPIVAVSKDESGLWRVSTLDDFPASQAAITRFLHELTSLTLWQVKTSDAQRYKMLGLEAIESDDAQGTKVVLSTDEPSKVAENGQQKFIVGLPISLNLSGSSAQIAEQQTWVNGVYVRVAEQGYSVLGALTLPVSESDWLDTSLLSNLNPKIHSLTQYQGDQSFSIAKDLPIKASVIESEGGELAQETMFSLKMVNGQTQNLPSLRYKTVFSGLVDAVSQLSYISVKKSLESYAQLKQKYQPQLTEIILKGTEQQTTSILVLKANNRYWLKVKFDDYAEDISRDPLASGVSQDEIKALVKDYIFELSPYYYRLLTRPFNDYTL